MKRLISIPLALLAVVMLAGLALAADMNANGTMSPQKTATFSASELHGLTVVNEDGKIIGEIKDLNIDSKTGSLRSVTLKGTDQEHYGVAPAWENRGHANQMDARYPNSWPFAQNIEIGGGA